MATIDSDGEVRGSTGERVAQGRLRTVDTKAAAKALTDLADTDCVLVKLWGLYRYDASSTATADDDAILELDSLDGRLVNDTLYRTTLWP